MAADALHVALAEEGHILTSESDFMLAGKSDAIRLEVGTLEQEVEYIKFDELLEAKKARFPRVCVDDVFIEYVDFNKVAPARVEELLEGCEMKEIKLQIAREHYNDNVFAFIQRLQNRGRVYLTMQDFILSKEELRALPPGANLRSIGNIETPVEDELLLDLVVNEHNFSLETNLSEPETIRDVYKTVSANETGQVVIFTISDDLFKQFLTLIGARMVNGKLVMEDYSEGFNTVDEDGNDFCLGDHTIYFQRARGIIMKEGRRWMMNIGGMRKEYDCEGEEFDYDVDIVDEGDSEDEED